jgi:uncharacterized protein
MNMDHTWTPVAQLPTDARSRFIVRVYAHLLAAVMLFVAVEGALFATGAAASIYTFVAGTSAAWLLLLGGVMIVSWFAGQAAHHVQDRGRQYVGLVGVVLAQAVIFAPFLYAVFNTQGSSPVVNAVWITALGFAGLTLVAVSTSRNLGFLRPLVMWGFIVALVLIVASVVFGANLGTWFSVAMVALAGGSILYQTQAVVRDYPPEAHVGAAVALFSSVMTLFWYVLRILSRR